MFHRRNDSLGSTASCLTSWSSDASVKFYEERIKPGIEALRKSHTSLQELVGAAEKIINEKFASDPRKTFKYKKDFEEISVDLDKVMISMLACAEECGGESGKRYVASAILTCSEEENVAAALAALVKTSRAFNKQSNEISSEFATPTIDKTASHLLEGVGNRKKAFANDVMRRDGYTCILTGFQDISHPKPAEGIFKAYLVCAHILRRALGQFDSDRNSESYQSAVTMFDILVNFTRLSVQTLEELHDQLDNPSNGLTLQSDARYAFDDFKWCLKQTKKQHEYELKIFKDEGIIRKPENNRICFEDHSNDFLLDSTRKTNAPVNLPDPRYLAIHAAIAGILNMSGAGKFFDQLLDKYTVDEEGVAAVRSWPELETLMGKELLKESLTKGFQSVDVL